MVRNLIILIPLFLSYMFSGHENINLKKNTVNTVIGDVSFFDAFRTYPTDATSEDLRLITHLEYVEKKLREVDISHLSSELKENRLQSLNYLRDYIDKQELPRNYVNPNERQSVFIDLNGRICAVGYLVQRTVGRSKAEEINKEYKLSNIFDIDSKEFHEWVSKSGFTLRELAMIQPTYEPNPPQEPSNENKISSGNRLSSTILTGVNLATNIINTSLAIRQEQDKNIALAGMITGSGQLILGIANYPKNTSISENKRDLSILNIGLGSLTLVLSSYNLFKAKENNDESFAIRLKSFSLPKNSSGIGIGFSKSF